jgi:hypothetical protein
MKTFYSDDVVDALEPPVHNYPVYCTRIFINTTEADCDVESSIRRYSFQCLLLTDLLELTELPDELLQVH